VMVFLSVVNFKPCPKRLVARLRCQTAKLAPIAPVFALAAPGDGINLWLQQEDRSRHKRSPAVLLPHANHSFSATYKRIIIGLPVTWLVNDELSCAGFPLGTLGRGMRTRVRRTVVGAVELHHRPRRERIVKVIDANCTHADGQEKLRSELVRLWSAYNKASGDTSRVDAQYLEVLATRSRSNVDSPQNAATY